MQPLISIVVPCYNQSSWLEETLQSIRDQEYSQWECIIIDDGSTDDSLRICEEWVIKEPRMRFYTQENSGVSSARNKGIALSKGKYILPLDADDYISKNYVKNGLEILEKNPVVKLVYGEGIFFGDNNGEWSLPTFTYRGLLASNQIHCAAIFKKSDFQLTMGYDEKMRIGLEDWEFYIRFLDANAIVKKILGSYLYYRIKKKSRNSEAEKEIQGIQTYILEKHQDKYAQYFGDYFKIIRENIRLQNDKNELLKSRKSIWSKLKKIITF